MHAMPKIVLQVSYQTCKRSSEKLVYGSPSNLISASTDGCLHITQFSNTWPGNVFPHQLSPSLDMTLLANFRSLSLYSNRIYVYFAQAYFRKGLISSTLKLPLVFHLKNVDTMEILVYNIRAWQIYKEFNMEFYKVKCWPFTSLLIFLNRNLFPAEKSSESLQCLIDFHAKLLIQKAFCCNGDGQVTLQSLFGC